VKLGGMAVMIYSTMLECGWWLASWTVDGPYGME